MSEKNILKKNLVRKGFILFGQDSTNLEIKEQPHGHHHPNSQPQDKHVQQKTPQREKDERGLASAIVNVPEAERGDESICEVNLLRS